MSDDLISITDLDALDRSYLTDVELGAGSVRRSVLARRRSGAELTQLHQMREHHEPLMVRQMVGKGERKMSTTSAIALDLGADQ